MYKIAISIFLFTKLMLPAQVSLEGFVKDRAGEVKDKAKEKARVKATESLEKQKKEFDESNFNYAISFLDNSGSFEAEEKGNAFTSTFLNVAKYSNNEEKSIEDRAYTNLKNGELLLASNKLSLAEQSFKLAKFLYEEDGKTSTLNYSQVLSDLGLLYQLRGRFSKSKPLHEQSLNIRSQLANKGMIIVSENNLGVLKKETGFYIDAEKDLKSALLKSVEQKDKLAQSLIHNNLAMTYLDMNKLKDAENQMHSSLTEGSQVLKEGTSNYIKLQINLANIYRFQKKYTSAEEIYLKAMAAKEKKLGSHPDLAHLKKGLAQIYMEMGKPKEAEKLLLSAYDIYKKKLGETNPATVATQHELANYYRFTSNATKALELMRTVVDQKKIIYGENHPNYMQALEDLALAQWENKLIEDAAKNYSTVIKSSLDYINNFFSSLNEGEKTQYWEKTSARFQRYYNFLIAVAQSDVTAKIRLYNTLINTKGFLLSNSFKIKNTILNSSDAELKKSYQQWLETKENLNSAYQLSKEELLEEKINLDSLIQRADELERELSQKSALFKESNTEEQIDLVTIQKTLKPNEAAVEILELSQYNNGFNEIINYFAFVVRANDIQVVEIGDGSVIASAISSFRDKVINLQPENEAYEKTWKIVDAQLKGINKVYLSLDGAYHQLSIAALKDVSGKYVSDKYSILTTGNTKDIISIKKSESSVFKPQTAFMIGNPLYGKSETIDQLPGTEAEVKKINKLLVTQKVKTTALFGEKATEASVKNLNSPSIVHFATHGYFLDDLSQMETNKILGVDITAAKENPLLRSGLLFAGCENVFDEGFRAAPNTENGVLTAYEAMNLNLDKTDLVVLSACQTGLGSVKKGEGVYGLQRSFQIAGAKSIIMSLWSVSDEATMQLMTLFYTNYVKSGNKNQAFSDAIKQLKIKYKEPYYWAAFVMLSR